MNEVIVPAAGAALAESDFISEALYIKWLAYIDVRPKSADTYRKAARQLINYFQGHGITRPRRDDLIAWRDLLLLDHKASTVQLYLTAAKLFFQWTEQEGLYPNIATHIKAPKITKDFKKDYLSSRQAKKILATMPRDTEADLRNYAIIALMLTTGLRDVEVSRANIEDLRVAGDDTVLFIQGKGRDEKAELVKVEGPVEDAIRDYLRTRPAAVEKQPLFASTSNNSKGQRISTRTVSSIAKKAMQSAGYDSDRLTAHSLRHTAGTLALLNGADLSQVQQLLRHQNINTTMIYSHILDRAANDAEARITRALFSH